MSKLSFRAKQLDVYKAMPIFHAEEIPDVAEVAAINRAVPQMPTGMEKDEETEHHLQRALSAQQVYGTAEALVIPVPEIDFVDKDYDRLYKQDYKLPKQYIHVQALAIDQEIPDYDMDSDDEEWLSEQSKKMEITPYKFEEMIDRLEKGSGQQVVTLQEAKLLLKEDDDLIIAVYDYWLNKRLKNTPHSLVPYVKTEKRDGSTTNNPYVAFRRRTEKMQTRKNRKNDEVSYEKMLKLRRDLTRALTILEMIKKREKSKKEMMQLSIEILDKRYDMEDFNGSNMAYAESQKMHRARYPLQDHYNKDGVEIVGRKQKREYHKRKHKNAINAVGSHRHYSGDVDVLEYGSTEDEPLSPTMSQSGPDEEEHPDGIYVFQRKRHCQYHAPLNTISGNWPWCGRGEGGLADRKYRYTLTSMQHSGKQRCIGFARSRRGRGGRMIFDRALEEERADYWDQMFESTLYDKEKSQETTFQQYIKSHNWLHFTSVDDSNSVLNDSSSLDTLQDSIIDIVPDSKTQLSSHEFSPIICAPVVHQTTTLEHPKPERLANTPSSLLSTKSETSMNYDNHQKQLLRFTNHQKEQSNSIKDSKTLLRTSVSQKFAQSSGPINANNRTCIVDSKKAVFAISALVNGGHIKTNGTNATTGSSGWGGNGLKLNGPSSKVDRFTSSPSALRPTSLALPRSSDSLITTETLINTNDIIRVNSLPRESGDNIESKPTHLTPSEVNSLGIVPEVGSTMEVS